ncbi:MAG TPA: ABC transporter ATP-binding protein [Clostridia bacterium]|nr:ABC transporter ATP-binding protein [Clostridia bacterium]
MRLLDVKNLTVRFGEKTIVDDVGFSLEEGQWLMIVGPNGAGKSTIINAVSQGTPYTGEVQLLGKDVRRYRAHELAKLVGVLAQTHTMGYGFTVGSVVRLGRYAYAPGLFSSGHAEDEAAVAHALSLTGLTQIAGQNVLTLSGGELQRTFLAQLFAQNPRVLLLDEPTNHLDLVYQKQVFELIREWLKTPGRAVASVVHDLSLARAYGSHALLLDAGKTLASGAIVDVFSQEQLDRAYQMDVSAWMRGLLSQWQPEEPLTTR